MNRRLYIPIAIVALVPFTLVGCQQPTLAEMMHQPERHDALDQLDVFTGKWHGSMKFMMVNSDETMTSTGNTHCYWAAGKRLLIEEGEYELENGETMTSYGIWMYDPKIEKFRYWWFTDWDMMSAGTAHYDADDDEWVMKGKSHDLASGQKWSGKGTSQVDGDTMTWHAADYVGLIPMKVMEMQGHSHRH